MKKPLATVLTVLLLAGCTGSDQQLRQRAAELCRFIPDHGLKAEARDYMTPDFYAVLDTMFNHLPDYEAMDHEWLYYFVTGNGGTMADFSIADIELTDPDHAVATVEVRQHWDDDEFEPLPDTEEHTLYMEHIDGRWLMADFDDHKADCIRHIAISRRIQARRDAIADYLTDQVGSRYLQGSLCIPTLLFVAEEDERVWGDFWVYWYTPSADTLKCISGGNHAGLITLADDNGKPVVTAFEQTVDGAGNDASARRIFGPHYDVYRTMHANPQVQEAARRAQLRRYLDSHNIHARFYQDYGWPPVEIAGED